MFYFVGVVSLSFLIFTYILTKKYPSLKFIAYDFIWFLKARVFRKRKAKLVPISKLFRNYIRYTFKYFIRLEFAKKKLPKNPLQDKLLNFKLFFINYETMIPMFNEIFCHDVYAFYTNSELPFIIDCGSNIGLATLYFKTLYPNARIIAFEACPETFEILKKNVLENNLSYTKIYNKALHDKEGKITFYVNKNKIAHGGWSIKSGKHINFHAHEQKIYATPLSRYIDGPVDLLKIDIEGAEDAVLKELIQSGKLSYVKQILLEYHHHMIDTKKDSLGEILKMFEDNNFGYQINCIEVAVLEKRYRNVLILHVYNKNFFYLDHKGLIPTPPPPLSRYTCFAGTRDIRDIACTETRDRPPQKEKPVL
jgi:FkbM family methyltransferase